MAAREGDMKPSLLLVEDDATSAAFLRAASMALPAEVVLAGTAREAARLARAGGFDLWLFDAQLPDGNGIDLLRELRAAGFDTPALAHTAAHDAASQAALRTAGFDAVVCKPLTAEQWRRALRDTLGHAPAAGHGAAAQGHVDAGACAAVDAVPVWDDDAAARALGDTTHIATMRGLLRGDLSAQRAAILAGDAAARQRELHKLRASCGLTGAARLQAAVIALQQSNGSPEALRAFDAAAQATLASP